MKKLLMYLAVIFSLFVTPVLAGMNGPVCKANPCTLNEPGGYHTLWFAKVDTYASKGFTFKTLPSKSKSFWPKLNDWKNGRIDTWPTGYCTSACAMTAGKLYNEGKIKIDPDTWFCFCHKDMARQWNVLGTSEEYDAKWFDKLFSGEPFKLKDVQ